MDNSKKIKCQYTKYIVCPYCGHVIKDLNEHLGDQDEPMDAECPMCDEEFIYITSYTPSFNSFKRD